MDEFGLATVTPARARVVKDFAASELFARTFHEGMELVEETAAYLDGAGRQESKLLSRNAALAYASTSMRLTTRLMQVASWLLVQRAVREGDMTADEACQPRYRIAPVERPANEDADEIDFGQLPNGLNALAARAERLYVRVNHLDRRMYVEARAEGAANPVLSQFERLQSAFGTG